MRTRLLRTVIAIAAAFAATVACADSSRCCVICRYGYAGALGDRIADADASVVGRRVSATPGVDPSEGKTTYQVVESLKGDLKGPQITIDEYVADQSADLVLLLGAHDAELRRWVWWRIPATKELAEYLQKAPARDVPPAKRLPYYIEHLKSQDPHIAADVFHELTSVPFSDLSALSDGIPRDTLREWLKSSATPAFRHGLYAMMLGACGTDEDAAFLKSRIGDVSEESRPGLEGLISGYLLASGEKGLEWIEQTRIRRRDVSLYEVYAAFVAVRFMWDEGSERIPRQRLKDSLGLLMLRLGLSDLAVLQSARWKDWSLQGRLVELYGNEELEFDRKIVRRAVINYMLASTKDVPPGVEKLPQHVANGRRYLEQLREKDPKLVAECEKKFFLK